MTLDIPSEWTFNTPGVAEGFDAHVREQLPWYDLVTEAIVQIGRHYIGEGGLVYDIGASNGNVGRALGPVLRDRDARLVSIERAPEMAERFQGPGEIVVADASAFDYDHCDFAVAMLSLMFMRPDRADDLLMRVRSSLRYGGALVIVERTTPPAGYLSVVTSRLTLAAKAKMGAPNDEIVAKELSLAGVQRPLDPKMLALHDAVEWFRFGDFAGYVIEAAA